eukprot:COSAG04_NODE_513_length_13214_cov_17.630576_6_plen_118_part_00
MKFAKYVKEKSLFGLGLRLCTNFVAAGWLGFRRCSGARRWAFAGRWHPKLAGRLLLGCGTRRLLPPATLALAGLLELLGPLHPAQHRLESQSSVEMAAATQRGSTYSIRHDFITKKK